MALKWRYGLIKDDQLIGAIKTIPKEGELFAYGNRDGKIVSSDFTVKDVFNPNSSENGEITLDNGETYIFYPF